RDRGGVERHRTGGRGGAAVPDPGEPLAADPAGGGEAGAEGGGRPPLRARGDLPPAGAAGEPADRGHQVQGAADVPSGGPRGVQRAVRRSGRAGGLPEGAAGEGGRLMVLPWLRRLVSRLGGAGELPGDFRGELAGGEYVLAVARAETGPLVATNLGLWLPEGRRVDWHLISKATWQNGVLAVVE